MSLANVDHAHPVPPALLVLEAPLRAALEAGASVRRYRRGEALFKQGEMAAAVFCIRSGALKLVRERPQGPRIVHLALPGDLLGLNALLADRLHVFSAVALNPGESLALNGERLMDALKTSRPFGEALLRHLAEDLTAAREELALQGGLPMTARLARLLLDLHLRFRGSQAGAAPSLHFTRYDLADILGGAQETISRSLGVLEAAGLIARQGRNILVQDPTGLLVLSKSDRSNISQTLTSLRA